MTGQAASLLERLPLARDRPALGYAGAVLICGLALLARLLATPVLPDGYPYVSFFPAVILSTFLFGIGPGLVAGVLCGLLAWYCFIPPFFAVKMSGAIMLALLFYAVVVAIDILLVHWLQNSNLRLARERERNRRLVERGELMFRELQHRVSNNLQVASGLLALQMRAISDGAAREALDEAARRLALIGRIHRQLYSPHGERLELATFLEQLGADLVDASGKAGISFLVEASEDVDLAAEGAVPMALIIAEAITNAIEHGFRGRDSGSIRVRVSRAADTMVDLAVIDDGAGLPPGFDLDKTDSLGLKLAQMLARQLGGSFALSSGGSTVALLRIP